MLHLSFGSGLEPVCGIGIGKSLMQRFHFRVVSPCEMIGKIRGQRRIRVSIDLSMDAFRNGIVADRQAEKLVNFCQQLIRILTQLVKESNVDLRLWIILQSPGHHRNWLDCIRSRERPVADVEFGARTVTIIHLENLAYWHHRPFDWNANTWTFVDPNDNRLLDRERRDPWQLPEV